MSDHAVTVTLPERPIEKAAVIFWVSNGTGKLGELRVSQGGLRWSPRHGREGRELRATWEQFARFMEGDK